MFEYQVGDSVLVRTDLIVGMEYNGTRFVDEMAPYQGKYITISEVKHDGLGVFYKAKGIGYYSWDPLMLVHEDPPVFDICPDALLEVIADVSV